MTDTKDDKSLFQAQFGGIQRVHDDRVEEWKPKLRPKPRQDRAADIEPTQQITAYPDLPTTSEQGIDDYHYRANGIQDKVIKQLKRGQIQAREHIDLHGMTREVALNELERFITFCQQQGVKCIHIVHGKGYQSEHGRPVLKPSVAIWLKQMPAVLAYCPALPQDGGDGALYVLLKRG